MGFECLSVCMLCTTYFCFTHEGWCCTRGNVIIQKIALVPGLDLSTCLEKLWKHHATNGKHLSCLCIIYKVIMRFLIRLSIISKQLILKAVTKESLSFVPPLLCFCSSLMHPPVHPFSVCHRGYFNCSYSPCPAVCTVYSDRHYHTFDGLEYDYHSDCQVYLLKVSRLAVWIYITTF